MPLPIPNHLQSRGFTLLELMIVVAIIAALSGFAIPNFSNYIEGQNLRQAQDQVQIGVRTVQLNALSGVTDNVVAPRYWGIIFKANEKRFGRVIVDSIDGANLNTACNNALTSDWSSIWKSEALPADVEIQTDACFFFDFESGAADCELSGEVYVNHATNPSATTYGISVNSSGTVYTYNGTNPVSCP